MVLVTVTVDAAANSTTVSTEIISVTSREPVTGDTDTTTPYREITGHLISQGRTTGKHDSGKRTRPNLNASVLNGRRRFPENGEPTFL